MIIYITYAVPTAGGNWVTRMMTADSFEEAEQICESVEVCGYNLIDVTRDVYEA